MASQKGFTESDKERMRKLYKTGYTYADIARKFNTSDTVIRYHVNKDYRKLVIKASKERRENPEGKKYQRKYYMKRYYEDEDFRKRHIKRVRRWQKENPEKNRVYKTDFYEKNRDKKHKHDDSFFSRTDIIVVLILIFSSLIVIAPWLFIAIIIIVVMAVLFLIAGGGKNGSNSK